MNVTPKCAALLYLNWWCEIDRQALELFSQMSQEQSPDLLHHFLTKYGVALRFPGLAKGEKKEKILKEILKRVSEATLKETDDNPIRAVKALAEKLHGCPWDDHQKRKSRTTKHLDKGEVVSASKLLWLRNKDKVIIYDERTRSALAKRSGRKLPKRDYQTFFGVWQKQYRDEKCKIVPACENLVSVCHFSRCSDIVAIEQTVNKPWFHMRVFDQMLWNEGDPASSSASH